MENGRVKRITISAIAVALVLGLAGGAAQQTAKYAIRASGGDVWVYRSMVQGMDSIAQLLTSPLFIIFACFAAGAAIYSWTDFIFRNWFERWHLTGRLSFRSADRKLIAMTLVLIFGGGFIISFLWFMGERRLPSSHFSASPRAQTIAHRLVENARIDWSGHGKISLKGRYSRSGGPVSVYIKYASIGVLPPLQFVINGQWGLSPRVKIATLPHFDREEEADINIGTTFAVDGNQQILQWGDSSQSNASTGITWGNTFASLIIVDGDHEEFYPFAIVSRAQAVDKPVPPVIIGPDILIGRMAELAAISAETEPLLNAPTRAQAAKLSAAMADLIRTLNVEDRALIDRGNHLIDGYYDFLIENGRDAFIQEIMTVKEQLQTAKLESEKVIKANYDYGKQAEAIAGGRLTRSALSTSIEILLKKTYGFSAKVERGNIVNGYREYPDAVKDALTAHAEWLKACNERVSKKITELDGIQ